MALPAVHEAPSIEKWSRFDILVAGEINPDLILTGEDLIPRFGQHELLIDGATLAIGSSSAIFACGAARLGLRVAFVGIVGDDLFGHYMLDAMHICGVDVSPVIVDKNVQTGLSVILNRGTDRAILTFPGCISKLTAQHVSTDLLSRSRHLHVASYFLQTALQPDLPDLFRHAHSLGVTTSLDTNWDPQKEWAGFDKLLQLVDVFLPNENEALAISQAEDLSGSLDWLAARSPLVVVKLGARGAVARTKERSAFAPALPVQVVDTVGAGDSFDAGFLYGYLNGWPLERSLRLACVCGSLSTRAAGGTGGQPTLDEAIMAMDALG